MTYGEVKTSFTALLNRRDATASQIEAFLQDSIARIQRNLRVDAMEATSEVTITSYDGIDVPDDYLQLIRISNSYGEELTRVDLTTAKLRATASSGIPKVFARQGLKWFLGPEPEEDDVVTIDYFSKFEPVADSNDENLLTTDYPDLLIAAAMSFATEFFKDKERHEVFESRYVTAFEELQSQYDRDQLTGNAVVQPALYFPSDLDDE